ncbi:DNA-protecting protein DprA [Lusitaniella coriacea LEGE 07157]|uniref:DNA-protecting protein DprA n=1 Tax=Lusitaniella coriacea LEGE 07157 TaxID=945747 RepID=A0A8J7DZK9_9CYAN|nr:DNA-processing protein DprA [Lusitaniella coriacea]MBE9117811.1 DNA-protecting protein DprA [Lusitaniella coriacea LEGE 07157]
MLEERAYWLAWSQVLGVGPILLQRLHQHFGTLATAWDAPLEKLREVEGIGNKVLDAVREARSRVDPETLFQQHCENNFNFWTPIDEEYPRLLLEIPSPPPILYYRGQVNLQENLGSIPAIGIVGTRNATEYGRRWTKKISAALAQHGFTVVSGMALGIDTEAHRSCLDAGGRTIAVLGTGIDTIYPHSNNKLYEQIQQQGLVLSEYPPGTQPEAKNFPPRNRIIAGLCRAILVMEAAKRSGALITSRYANEFNRDVYALPGSLNQPQSMGCLELANRGAQMILGEGSLLEMLGEIPQLDRLEQPSKPLPVLSPELAKVLDAIAPEPVSFDAIVQNSGLSTGDVSGAILQLELLGLITSLPGMRYQRL